MRSLDRIRSFPAVSDDGGQVPPAESSEADIQRVSTEVGRCHQFSFYVELYTCTHLSDVRFLCMHERAVEPSAVDIAAAAKSAQKKQKEKRVEDQTGINEVE